MLFGMTFARQAGMPEGLKTLFGMTSTRQAVMPEGLKAWFGMTSTRQAVMPSCLTAHYLLTTPPFYTRHTLHNNNCGLCPSYTFRGH